MLYMRHDLSSFSTSIFLEWDPTAMDYMEEGLVTTNIDEYWHDCVDTVMHTASYS